MYLLEKMYAILYYLGWHRVHGLVQPSGARV